MRESPAGSGESDAGDWREVNPREDAGKSCEAGEGEKPNVLAEQLHSPYEEELDPRIQVRHRDGV